MISPLLYITGFLACAALIIFSGTRLARYGNMMAELLGMGKAWFGLIMMSAVTSLPELFTGISSILIVDTPDIAMGNIMGSCAFNFLILAILDYFVRGKPLLSSVTKSHVLAGFFGIFLITLTVISIVFSDHIPMIGWVSSSSVLLIALYFLALRIIFKKEQRDNEDNPHPSTFEGYKEQRLNYVVKRYLLFGSLVITGAIALPFFADHLAEEAALNKSFVGTLLVAAVTSLPEMVVAITAVKMGSMDIAVGNLFGGILYNMLILGLDDLMYTPGSLYSVVDPSNALSGLVILLMTAVVGIGILYSSPSKRFALGIDAIVLVILYTTLILALFSLG